MMRRKIRPYLRILRVLGVAGLISAIREKVTGAPAVSEVRRPEVRSAFFLRPLSTDVAAFVQVFVKNEYDFDVVSPPRVIVDAGANIGLAAIYFANKYPQAKIIAIEPEESNFAMLRKNAAPYPNIVAVQAALWGSNEEIDLVDPGRGKWGFMTRAGPGSGPVAACHKVPGMTVDRIMADHGLERIDILKIDIEGAEREVFRDSSSWIGKVDALIVELHERMKSGCNRSFYNGSNGFDAEWTQGENVYLTRSDHLIRLPR